MPALRPVEERDKKGNTLRVNPSVTFKQDQNIRHVRGRHDYSFEPNPDFHPPITAQVQDGKLRFFSGVPDSAATRAHAKELKLADVPAYIVEGLRRNPLKVREARPMVYEVKIVQIGDQEVTTVEAIESQDGGMSVTIEPIAPDTSPAAVEAQKRRRASRMPEALRAVAEQPEA
jgi:hypothetical protein